MLGRSAVCLVVASLGLCACGPNRIYSWGNYDETLYAHYKNPAQQEDHLVKLKEIVERDEAKGVKMPPGVYADYGYALYQAGQPDQAIVYFEKERATWPESAALVEKLIRNVKRQPSPARGAEAAPTSAEQTAAGSTEGDRR